MSKKAFDKISEGLTEALAIARGEASPAKLHVPAEINVRAIRRAIGMSQDDFASAFGFSVNQIRDWEQGRSRPLGGVRAYLLLIKSCPDDVRKLLVVAAKDAEVEAAA
ncbi:DNA-binding transcriptional regulator [Pleomorphomonas sp. NRK KF1]|jgi:putative transcriptional regulator|uniref:helix-turn-helix domain-containing protein n=1 Tax=Pleomorphomonas sp. NRK KF1 TaxID=2943000 RepID=UPI00204335E6|nr:helix-turn-helix domain-containing protein [Pleomorphomonas sp. NRK KF1]MCM5554518.1 helix-turn-helix domain-containing protein [Pleomorphomonas sp. NRK KF1]